MKRSLCVILIVFALLGVAVVGCVSNGQLAHALDGNNYLDVLVDGESYRLRTVTVDEQVVGVSLADNNLFGDSNIPVTVDVYSTPQLVIDFPIGGVSLTETQLAARQTVVDLFSEIIRLFVRVNALVSTSYDGSQSANGQLSEVVSYNNASSGTRLQISYDTYQMLLVAQQMYVETYGAFNPAVYRLVDLWGFSSRIYSRGQFGLSYDRPVSGNEFYNDGYPLPDEKYVEAFSNADFTDFSPQAVVLEQVGEQYFVTKNVSAAIVDGESFEQWIDLGGIAKGYAVDKASELISRVGIASYRVNAGGSSIALGLNYDGGSTNLGMVDAFDPFSEIYAQSLLEVKVGNSLVSTSGQNIRKYTVDGVEYAHIIDGISGAPAQTGVRSVMVVVPQSAMELWAAKGDCLTTALTVMGRDQIVSFANGYLKQNGIKIVVQYETLDGRKQLLSNYDQSEIIAVSDSYKEFGWALMTDENGNFYYDANAKFSNPIGTYQWILIVIGCVLGVGAVALVTYHFVRGRKGTAANVQNAKKDKPFKTLDVMVYLAVVLLILVLFYVFILDVDDTQLQLVNVIDDDTGETLFVYNVTRGEYSVNANNANGWTIQVEQTSSGVEVTFTRVIAGEERFNVVSITRGRNPYVKMTNSICGFHKDCVRNFPAITRSGGAIVCSPNRLKIVT